MTSRSWLTYVLYPLVVGLLVGAVALSLVELMQVLTPGWHGAYLTVFLALAAVEGYYSYYFIQNSLLRISGAPAFQLAQCGALLLLLQLVTNVSEGRAPVAGVPRFDVKVVLSSVLALFFWLEAGLTARDLDHLDEPPERDRTYTPPAERLAGRFFAGGAILLLAAGLARVGLSELLDPSRLSPVGPLLNVLLYFLLGLILLGQVHYALLHHWWREQRVGIAAGLTGRWVRYSAAFLGLVALLAALLPTNYTLGLLDLLRAGVGLVLYLLEFLVIVVTFPFLWLLSHLFPGGGVATPPALPSFPVQPPPPSAAASPGADWLGVARSLLFWGVVLVMLLYLIRTYLAQHPRVARALAGLGPLRLLRRLWAALWRRLRGYARSVGERLPRLRRVRPADRTGARGLMRRVRLGALPPRERVLYYYLSIVRRADRQGLPRRRPQTPAEYRATLATTVPQAERDVRELTEAFEEARYSLHDVAPPRVSRARANWQRVKAALQALRRV